MKTIICKNGTFVFKIIKILKKYFFKNIEVIEDDGNPARGNRSDLWRNL
jgi:hypothetical protein